jgi:hypothetical protein
MKPEAARGWSLADTLVNFAASSLPSNRADWGAAMRAELRYMSDRRSALLWALGCLRAGMSERFLGKSLLDTRTIRWLLSLWLAYRAENDLCDVAFVLSYKAPQLGLKALLGACAQGEDYRRLIPLLDVTTYWTLAAWLAVSGLYMLAIVSLLRRTSHAARLFILAATLGVVLWLRELGEPLFVGAFSLTDHLCDALLYVGTALLAWFLWANSRKHSSLTL